MRTEPAVAAQSAVLAAPAVTRVASQTEGAGTPLAARPSPFLNPPSADRQQLPASEAAPAPAPTRSADKTDKKVRKRLKPFYLSTTQSERDRVVTRLPAPPELTLRPAGASALPFAQRVCCVGTATAEPARPARLQRVLRKVPGIRRLHQSPETEEGFVPARPSRTITMVLPPQTRSVLPEGSMELKASVNETGGVTRVELLSPKDEELVRLSAYAASEWKFVPAQVADRPVPSEVILHFDFRGK